MYSSHYLSLTGILRYNDPFYKALDKRKGLKLKLV